MATSINRSWSIAIVVAALLFGGFASVAWTSQDTQGPTIPKDLQEEAERIRQMIQEQRKSSGQNSGEQPRQSKSQEPTDPSAAAAPAEPTPPPIPRTIQRNGGRVRLNYENADLYDFINQIASTLGITPIVIDPDIKGTVNVLSTEPMSREDIFPLFSLILKNNNAALIEEGGIYQIVPISSALKKGVKLIEELPEATPQKAPERNQRNINAPPPTDGGPVSSSLKETFRMLKAQQTGSAAAATTSQAQASEDSGPPQLATHVIRADFIPVQDLIEPIRLFMTEGGVIMPYERLNMLILTDYTDSVSRIMEIIRMLDNEYLDPDLIDLIKIENNASTDVVDDLNKIFGSGTDESTGISFVSLDRLNSIFVIASSKRGLAEVKRWIAELDGASGRKIQTHIYVVQNSTASNIAMMLAALYGGEDFSGSFQEDNQGMQGAGAGAFGGGRGAQSGSFAGSGSDLSTRSQTASANTPFGNQGLTGGQSFGMGGFGSFTTGQQLGPRLSTGRGVTSQVLQGGEFTGLQDTVRMVVDDINNQLIIQATSADYAYILETIKKMDVLPRQVLIDARVFEVDLTEGLNFGVNAILQGRGATGESADHSTGGQINWLDPEGKPSGSISANTFAFVGNSREILLRLNALRLKTNVKILEAPSVLVLDGMQASIVVGSEYPYPGGSYTSSAGGSTTSVGYRPTGIQLLVEPQISASGSVTLNITQEVSSPGASVDIGDTENAPSFSMSRVMTTLSVRDGETVAIAGLIRDSEDFSRSGVPILSEIPVLGYLFGQTSKNSRRTELIILITPHVIRTVDAFQQMTQELRDSLRNVRKYADEKDREHIKDMEDAREERYEREQEIMNDRKRALE